MPPEFIEIKSFPVFIFTEYLMYGGAEGDILDGVHPDENQGLVQIQHFVGKAEVGGVDKLQDARCKGRIHSDDVGKLLEVCVLSVAGLDYAQEYMRKRGKVF